MSLAQAEAVTGPPDNLHRDQHEAWWDPGFRCYFSDDWILLQISVMSPDPEMAVPVVIGDLEVSGRFEEAERQLVALAGEGYRHPMEYLTVFPNQGLAIWSEEGDLLDDFGCTTSEQVNVVWPEWSTKYTRLRA
jgi:hypothetical protein